MLKLHTMKASLSILVVMVLLLTFVGSVGATQFLSIGTSSVGGTSSIMGSAMAVVINKNVEGVKVNIEITGGYNENVRLVAKGLTDFGLTDSPNSYEAFNGIGRFKDDKLDNIRGVIGGPMNVLHFYTLANSGIKSIKDLKGKTISIGSPGSQGNSNTIMIMDAYGFEKDKDWTPEYIGHSAGREALADGNVDAVVIISTVPTTPVTEISMTHKVRLLSLDRGILDKILEENQFLVEASIPGGVYRGVDNDVKNLFAIPTIMITYADLSEEIVYKVTKALLENNKALVEIFPLCKAWSIDNATRGLENIIPMHPGVEKYLKEKGLM